VTVRREGAALGLRAGLLNVDLRKEKVDGDIDLQREAIGQDRREMIGLGFLGFKS
jgi:hypothetical protein